MHKDWLAGLVNINIYLHFPYQDSEAILLPPHRGTETNHPVHYQPHIYHLFELNLRIRNHEGSLTIQLIRQHPVLTQSQANEFSQNLLTNNL